MNPCSLVVIAFSGCGERVVGKDSMPSQEKLPITISINDHVILCRAEIYYALYFQATLH